ncbi:hypothetical protein E1176_13045 [Fulvivirga sp. RKSG066]|uniref:hypothetical protein n=1 Tax=Fulvivirga aurantia TaxID=2529383 RepID=UPI0012BCA66A|nr:hypothetical protein [Fulvivirga aurantia]MTI21952.1 hypothetical protein [Fulvivirga aurantia]
MQYRYLVFLICSWLIALAPEAVAQKKRSTNFYKGRYKPINISRSKASVVCPIFEDSQYPYHGIGFKLGDPFAFTYKFYPHKRLGFVIDAGSAASGLYSEYHRNNFSNYTTQDTLNSDQGISYTTHKVNSEWVLEGKVLFQQDASDLLKGLQWYVGAGWQWRQLDIEYEYILEINFTENEIGKLNVSNVTMGPVAAVGIEYAYFELPISAFLEVEGYYDVVEDPGWMRLQGGVGLRYIF